MLPERPRVDAATFDLRHLPRAAVDTDLHARHADLAGPCRATDDRWAWPKALAGHRARDERVHREAVDAGARAAGSGLAPAVVDRLERPVERARDGPDRRQPLHRIHRVPAGHDHTQGPAEGHRDRFAVHLVREQGVGMERLMERQRAGVRVDTRVLAGSAVGAAQHDLDRFSRDPGAAQDVAERDARPDGLGDRADPPWSPSPGRSSSVRLCPAHSSTTGRVRCSNVRSVTAGRTIGSDIAPPSARAHVSGSTGGVGKWFRRKCATVAGRRAWSAVSEAGRFTAAASSIIITLSIDIVEYHSTRTARDGQLP